jgi:transposase-like protein
MTITKEFLDELLKGCERPEDLLGDAGLMKELKIRLMKRMLGAELTAHLGYEDGKDAPPNQSNRRNGTTSKRLKGQDGEVPISVPRDRDGSFEPELVNKGQTRIDGMDDKIIHCPAGDLHGKSAERGPLRRWSDGARHPRPSRGRLRSSGVTGPDQSRH